MKQNKQCESHPLPNRHIRGHCMATDVTSTDVTNSLETFY